MVKTNNFTLEIRRSIINIQNWFNSPILSDIKIYSTKSNNSSPVFHCHQIVIYLNSPNLLQALKNNKVGDKDYHVYIIEELLDKPHETELFLKSLYEPSVLGKTENIITKGLPAPILEVIITILITALIDEYSSFFCNFN